ERRQLDRAYGSLSATAFAIVSQGIWEVLLTVIRTGMIDGGPAGLIWSFIFTSASMLMVVASLAEMASMAPHAGGQYYWTLKFAPVALRKPVSYVVGLMSVLSWQAGTASGPFLVGALLQASIVELLPDYAPTSCETTVFIMAIPVVVWGLSVRCAGTLPSCQVLMLALHTVGCLTFTFIFWTTSPRASIRTTLFEFTNRGGWSSTWLAVMVGQVSAIYACI
ncbi:hypothetical protein EJ07DRAFT_11446, partial [Lizonia empirigonia]